ncbi:MAG TPA: myo-inosose-2 dehydratase [Opitutaceae bacterium]|nr:myo-inosose-2 dehydratase [Opitutaceae bacterium]
MNSSVTVPPATPAVLAGCEVGANPIIWSNDDFPELAGDLPLDVILREMKACGYAGSELGHAYPRTATSLGAALGRHGLKLVSGWHSTHLATRPLPEEEAAFRAHATLLKALGARVVIVAECSHAVHGQRDAALGYGENDRRVLGEAEWARLAAGLGHFAAWAEAQGLKLAYHHHMGTVIQTAAELDRLLAASPGLSLLLDPGHLAFAGIDPRAVMRRHGARVAHVHLKSVRADVVARARRERWSFCRAVTEGVFAIPGEGVVDFPALFADLAARGYRGWLVVEAEEDPAKAPALPKAQRARAFVRRHAGI